MKYFCVLMDFAGFSTDAWYDLQLICKKEIASKQRGKKKIRYTDIGSAEIILKLVARELVYHRHCSYNYSDQVKEISQNQPSHNSITGSLYFPNSFVFCSTLYKPNLNNPADDQYGKFDKNFINQYYFSIKSNNQLNIYLNNTQNYG